MTVPAGLSVEARSKNVLRIATFNVRRGKGVDGVEDIGRISGAIERFDVVGLNELSGFARGAEHQLELLARRGGYGFVNAPTERRMGRDAFGNGLLSRREVKAWRIKPLVRTTDKGYRNVLEADVLVGEVWVRVIATHLDRSADREAQLGRVIGMFLEHNGPVVLMGDLNSDATDEQIAGLLRREDVLETLRAVGERTPERQIDWMFVRGMKLRDAGWEDRGYSDHPMLWAELELGGQ
jgi:endonuclease/exonuclease/phosphatase family metal-dependent hydrolase